MAQRMSRVGARIAVPGVMLTPDGFACPEGYLDAGGPVPDAWHVHLYFCYMPDGIDDRLDIWGEWMQRRDVNRPTIISEFNALGRDVGQQIAMMRPWRCAWGKRRRHGRRGGKIGCGRCIGFR